MSEQIVYYTLKYGKKYYSPYLHNDMRAMSTDVQSMLTDHRELAVRFGDEKTANHFKEMEVFNRTLAQEPGFDEKQVKVVKITKKIRQVH